MQVEVRHVNLPHVVSAAELSLNRVKAFHLEVLVLEVRVDRVEIDATPHLVVALLWKWDEG